MKAKATHKGTCQICGRSQKLPNGLLSRHGYTKRWGFFHGDCEGSRERPFEVSCDLIKGAIDAAEKQAARMRDEADARERGEFDQLLFHHYIKPTWENRRGGYAWIKVDVVFHDGEIVMITEDSRAAPIIRGRMYSLGQTIDSAVKELNRVRSVWLRREAKRYDEYAEWQRQRIANWKRTELETIK